MSAFEQKVTEDLKQMNELLKSLKVSIDYLVEREKRKTERTMTVDYAQALSKKKK